MFPTCPVCNHPVRRRNRTVHKSCADALAVEGVDVSEGFAPIPMGTAWSRGPGTHECCFCRSTDTSEKDGGWFCEKHYPYDERTTVQQRTLTATPERCDKCGEAITPKVTMGKIKCECDQPSPPRPCEPDCNKPHAHLTEAAWLARMGKVPTAVRYGN